MIKQAQRFLESHGAYRKSNQVLMTTAIALDPNKAVFEAPAALVPMD